MGNKWRQRVIDNLRHLEELREGQLDRLIDSLARYRKSLYLKRNEAGANWSKQWGPALIFHRLWEKKGQPRGAPATHIAMKKTP